MKPRKTLQRAEDSGGSFELIDDPSTKTNAPMVLYRLDREKSETIADV